MVGKNKLCYSLIYLIVLKHTYPYFKVLTDTNNNNSSSSGIGGGLSSLENSKLNKTEKEPEIIEKPAEASPFAKAFAKAFVPMRDSM
jgi:hypothetical protein